MELECKIRGGHASVSPLPSLRTTSLHGQGSAKEASAEERAFRMKKKAHTHTNDIIKARNNLGFHKTVLKLFEKGERSVFIISFFFAKRNSIYHNSNEVEGNIRKEIMHAPLNLNTVPLLYSLSIGVMIESEYGELV